MENNPNAIDIVYLWVDGNDPLWQAKRDAFIGKAEEGSPTNCKGRYANNDELKYSLRSIGKYAPWIHNIYIVTDNQKPDWLDTKNPRIKIIDHKDIMPPESLPCFNSSLIEHFIYKIPGLAEHFLCANDDTFLNKEVNPETFFTESGFPIVRLNRKPFRKIRWFWKEKIRKKPLKNYKKMISRSSQLVENLYGIYYSGTPHHNIDAYLRSDYQRLVENVMRDEFMANNRNHVRNDNDIHRSVLSYASLAEKRAKLRYVTIKESMYIQIQKVENYMKLDKYQPTFFCLNDSERVTDNDRLIAKNFLEKRFPEKSEFEI